MDILITVGASEYGLDRLLKIIDELCDEGILDGTHIIAQKGASKYESRNFQSFDLIAREDFQKYMEIADLIIAHAGTGSVIPPLKLGKKIIVFPRRECFGEHLDDHQLELSNVFTTAGYTLCAIDKQSMLQCLAEVENFSPKTFKSNRENMNKLIIDYIDNL